MIKFVNELINIGLKENEAKVYCCLLRKELFTATEIARCSGVNRSRIYSVLDGLIKQGLCIEKLGKVRKFQAVNPEIAFDEKIESEKKRLDRLKNLSNLLAPIFNTQQENSSPLDFIEVYGTAPSIIKKHHALELQAKEFVLSFCKAPYAMSNDLEVHAEQAESMKKNVAHKSIFEVEKSDLMFFARRMKNFQAAGEEIKVAYHLPIKLHVFDQQTVMFSLTNQLNPEKNLTYIVIEHVDLAETLIATFYKYWSTALTLEDFFKREKIEL
ncbi:MAG: helix-turn-helix domain-containing protein [Candidatus Cloacimonadales bacterium]